MAVGDAGNLDVADTTRGNETAQQHGEIAPDDLQVVEVQLQLQCGVVFQQGFGRIERIQQVARHVAAVDGFDENLHARLGGQGGGLLQVRLPARQGVGGDGFQSRHDMNARAVQRSGVLQGALDALQEFRFAAGLGRQTTFTGFPVAGRRIEECLLKAVFLEQAGQHPRFMFVGEQVLHGLKAVLGGGGKAFREGQVGVQEGEVGGESGHGGFWMEGCTWRAASGG